MKSIYFQGLMIIVILMILVLVLNLVSKKMFFDREKNSPFECGFDPKNFARLPFSLQFFMIAVIFVIFDVELTLLLPTILITKICNVVNLSTTLTIFILTLIGGLLHELKQGTLNWAK